LVVTAADITDPGGAGTQFDASLLHTQFSISYDDLQHAAATLGQEVIDASFTAVEGGSDPRLRGLTANPLGGAFDVIGQVSKVPAQDGNFTLHLSKGVDLRPRGLARVQALYASNAPAPYQGISMVFGTQGSWGFPEGVTGASTLDPESQMGAVPILAAAREYIYLAYGSSTSAMESKFKTLLDAISSSIGTMAAVPVLSKGDLGNVLPPMTAVYTDQTVDTNSLELVGVADIGANPNSGAILLGAQAGVAVDIGGDTLASLHDRSVFRSAAGTVDSVSLQRPIRRTAYTAVAEGTTLGFHKPTTDEYAYLAGPSFAGPPFLSVGGYLNAYASRLLAVDAANPSEPAFDGFGLPMHWTPPMDAAILGSSAAGPGASVQRYLDDAESAATAATAAVNSALGVLIQDANEEIDNGKLAQKSQQAIQAAQDELCGSGGTLYK
jgi:hypothetical protein